MSSKKYSTQFPGVRYRTNETKKYNGKPDKYFFIRYRADGKPKEEGIGWSSEGWNAKRVSIILSDLKKAHLTGDGPQTLAEKRELETQRRNQEQAEKERIQRESLSFGEYFENRYYPEAKNNKGEKSYKREKSLFELWIEPVIGKMPFKDIRPFHLEKLKRKMANADKAPRSIQYALAVVRQVFNHAIKNEIFYGESPTRKVSKPKVDNKRIRFLTPEEADILLEKLKTISSQLHDIALLSLHCGPRADEIFSLTWGCVNLDQGTFLLIDTKGTKNRTIYMTNEIEQMFRKMDQGNPTDLVFKSRTGGKIKEISNSFGRIIKELGFNDGIEDRRLKACFHTLRHTYASWLVQDGVDLYTVKELMGHSTLAMTERYAHLAEDNLKQALKKLEERLKRNKKKKVIKLKSDVKE